MKTANTFNISLLVVRVFLGTIVAAHGAQKLFGWFGGFGFEGTMQFFTGVIGLPYILALLIIVAETFGMVSLILGLFTRVTSASVILIMIGAVVTTHGQYGFFMNFFGTQAGEGIEFHLALIGLATVTTISGGGAYSLDNYLLRKWFVKPERKTSLA